jgi:lysophospholipase L1-like esterase
MALGLFELGSRALLVMVGRFLPRTQTALSSSLDEYEIEDPRAAGHWRLRPSFEETLAEAIRNAKAHGRPLRDAYLADSAQRLGLAADEIVVRINADGFRGPDLDDSRPGSRILTLGDSCTFGLLLPDRYTYPRITESALVDSGRDVEVVNGGVEGYTVRNLLLRASEYQALEADIATIYIGWNEIYGANRDLGFFARAERYSSALRVFRGALLRLRAMGQDPLAAALAAYSKPKHPDRQAAELRKVPSYTPQEMKPVEELTRTLASSGSRVALLTLPGLYTMHEPPSERALRIGHLPPFTDNPYVVAKLTDEYNGALRALAEEMELQLVDLAAWSNSALSPRDAFFHDAVHLNEEGLRKLGEYLAAELSPWLE